METIFKALSLFSMLILCGMTFIPFFTSIVFASHNNERRIRFLLCGLFTGLLFAIVIVCCINLGYTHFIEIFASTFRPERPDPESVALMVCDYTALVMGLPLSYALMRAGRVMAIKWVKTGSTSRAFLAFGSSFGDMLNETVSFIKSLNAYDTAEKEVRRDDY